MALLKTPEVTEKSWDSYRLLRDASLESMRTGVLPNIAAALDAYAKLDAALQVDNPDLFDNGDRALIAAYHPQAIALVAPAIDGMRQYMMALEKLAQQVDAAFVADGRAPLFGVRMPVEEQPE